MRYWWVNQNQTYRHEVQGGYLWSPKRNANGARNPFYESMREVAPGDLIFSFMDTRILAIGIAQSYSWECPKPQEFGNAGQNWENIGWKVKVNFTELANKIRPKDHINILRPLLPYNAWESTPQRSSTWEDSPAAKSISWIFIETVCCCSPSAPSARPSIFCTLFEADQKAILPQANDAEFERYITHAQVKVRKPMRDERMFNPPQTSAAPRAAAATSPPATAVPPPPRSAPPPQHGEGREPMICCG